MNKQKATEAVHRFGKKANFYKEKFTNKEPTVEELQGMKKDYVHIGIELNKAIDDPDVQKENVEALLNAATKSGVNKSDLSEDEVSRTHWEIPPYHYL
jgi:hypothetical protein